MKSAPRKLIYSALFLGLAPATIAQTLYWNPSPLTNTWDAVSTHWATTSGGSPTDAWSSGNNAIFDQAGTYTVTLSSAQTAGALSIAAGDVTLGGSLLTSNTINISAGASLTGAGNTLLKVGTTTLTVDGTWTLSSSATSTSARVSLAGGSGTIVANGNLRTNGNFTFAGDISGSGTILTDAAGTFTLGGNNTYTGNTLFRHGNTIRLNSANAISANSWLRFGAGTNIVELAAADFSRTLGTAAGQVRFHNGADGAGNSGFAAIGAERNVAINGTVVWGGGSFNPGVFHLGTGASTHTVTLTTGIDLNAATRIINTENGSSTAGGRVSGSLTNGTLQVQGAGNLILAGNNSLVTINKGASGSDTGTLILSGSNTFSNTTLNFGTNSENRGAIRLEHNNALGGITDINGNYTGTAVAQIQLANNVTISGINYALGGRSNATTTGSALVNVSGNNTWAGTLRIANTGGAYGIRSDAGTLTISGELRNGLGTARTWELTGSGDIDITGNIVNGSAFALGLLKTGNGVLTITGDSNTYTGGTTVNAGTMIVSNTSGSATGTGAVVVASGATLGGGGAISGDVTATGIIAPGEAGIGTLSTGSVTWNGNTTSGIATDWKFDLGAADASDRLSITGDFTGSGDAFWFDFLGSDMAGTFTLVTWSGSATGFDEADFKYTNLGGGLTGSFTLNSNSLLFTAIPEPSAALAGLLLAFGILRRRR